MQCDLSFHLLSVIAFPRVSHVLWSGPTHVFRILFLFFFFWFAISSDRRRAMKNTYFFVKN